MVLHRSEINLAFKKRDLTVLKTLEICRPPGNKCSPLPVNCKSENLEKGSKYIIYIRWLPIITINKNYYAFCEFVKLFGLTLNTPQKWDREGSIAAHRTPTSRYYTHDQSGIRLIRR
jgi:hypothetical protein